MTDQRHAATDECSISEIESWITLLEMHSDGHSLLQGAAGEDAMSVGDVLKLLRQFVVCKAVTEMCCKRRAAVSETGDMELARHLNSEHHAMQAQSIDSPHNACSLKETCLWLKGLASAPSLPSASATPITADGLDCKKGGGKLCAFPHCLCQPKAPRSSSVATTSPDAMFEEWVRKEYGGEQVGRVGVQRLRDAFRAGVAAMAPRSAIAEPVSKLVECPACKDMVRPDAPACLSKRHQFGGACPFHSGGKL